MLAYDGFLIGLKPIIGDTLQARREKIREAFIVTEGEFQLATYPGINLQSVFRHLINQIYRDIANVDDIQPFLTEAVDNSCEGLMVKTLIKESTYEPSKRSYNWLKVNFSQSWALAC